MRTRSASWGTSATTPEGWTIRLYGNPVAQLLIDACKAGPLDGGCLIVARALNELFPSGEIVHLWSNARGGQAEHYGLRLPDGGILDGEGRFDTAEAWIRHYENEISRRPLTILPGLAVHSDIIDDPKAAKRLARLLLITPCAGGEVHTKRTSLTSSCDA